MIFCPWSIKVIAFVTLEIFILVEVYAFCPPGFDEKSDDVNVCQKCSINGRSSCIYCFANDTEDDVPVPVDTVSYGLCKNLELTLSISIYPIAGFQYGGGMLDINITDGQVVNISKIFINENACDIMSTSKKIDAVECRIPESNVIGSYPLKFELIDGQILHSQSNYTYKQSPVVYKVYPSETILSGGLILTVIGDHFQKEDIGTLRINRVNYSNERKFTKLCHYINETVMACPTPGLYEDFQHKLLYERQRRSTDLRIVFNDATTQFWAGLRFGDRYVSFNETLDDWNQLYVFPDPILNSWDDLEKLQENLFIWGNYLDFACSVEDINVKIGNEICKVTAITTNHITCKVPPENNQLSKEKYSVMVYIGVGPLHFNMGKVTYRNRVINKMQVAASIVGSLFIALCIAAACVVYVKYKKKINLKKAIRRLSLFPSSSVNNYEADFTPPSDGYLSPVQSNSRSLLNMPISSPVDEGISPVIASDPTSRRVSLSPSILAAQYGNKTTVHRSNLRRESSACSSNFQTQMSIFPFDIVDEIPYELAFKIQDCLLEPWTLTLGNTIGKGFFGRVYKGELLDTATNERTTVAVKTVQARTCTVGDVISFLEEALIMKDLRNDNVLSLLGVVISDNKPYVVLPLMEHGDLLSYISDESKFISVQHLLQFGLQISNGMAYLSQIKFVHRDLATRNCMINLDLVVKIADFGLSRDIYRTEYYRIESKLQPLPIKWMAIESLCNGIFSSKSDVWAFGVVIWELLERCGHPYADINAYEMKAYLLSGRRLSRPKHAPDNIYELMHKCWLENPDERPTFPEISISISNKVSDYENYPSYITSLKSY